MLSISVQATTGKAGKAEAITEWAGTAHCGQGRAMISALDSAYSRGGGSGGGRVLWAEYDSREHEYLARVNAAVAASAALLQDRLDRAGA